jgi:hypothetical protein
MSGYDYFSSLPHDYDYYELDNPEISKVPTSHPLYDPEKVADYLNQKKVWINAARDNIRIKDMDKHYLYNVLAWFRKHENEIVFTMYLSDEIGKSQGVKYYNAFDFPLYQKIQARYLKLCGVKKDDNTTL